MIPQLCSILAAVLTVLVIGAGGCILGPLLPAMAAEFHQRVEVTGLLIGVTFFGSIAAVTIGGYLADRFGKKPLLLITLAGLVLAFLLFTVAPSFAVVAVACLLAGAMCGALEGLSGAVIADLDPARVDRNMNLLQVAFCAGAVLVLLVTAWLRAADGNWRLPYLWLAIGAGSCWFLGLGMRVPPAPPAERISLPIARALLADRAILRLALGIALYVGSEMSLAQWISPLLERHFAYTASMAMLGAGLFWLSMGVARVVIGFLCQRYPGTLVLKWLLIGGLLSFVVMLLPVGLWRLWVGVALAGATFSGVWPLIVSLGNARYPHYSGTTIAILVASGTVGGMLFPPLTGFVIARSSPAGGLLLMTALFVLLTLVVWNEAPARAIAVPSPVEETA